MVCHWAVQREQNKDQRHNTPPSTEHAETNQHRWGHDPCPTISQNSGGGGGRIRRPGRPPPPPCGTAAASSWWSLGGGCYLLVGTQVRLLQCHVIVDKAAEVCWAAGVHWTAEGTGGGGGGLLGFGRQLPWPEAPGGGGGGLRGYLATETPP